MSRPAWGHVASYCVYCGQKGPRVIVLGGKAHRRCVKLYAPEKKKKP